jgi:hypothetical protein
MKAKNWLLLTGLALSGLVWNGCYTQIARPDRDEDTQIASESESTVEESDRIDSQKEDGDQQIDDRETTNVYVYSGWYRPYWYYPSWSWYRYPRSRFYVSVGFGYYDSFDPWGWCGTPWGWYDPWDYYYAGYWDPYYYGWHSPRYYSSYYPRHIYRDRVVTQTKRPFTRRGSSAVDNNSPGNTYATSGSRGSLARPVAGTFARGDDGNYRRVRRTDATSTDPNRDNGSLDNSGRRTLKRATNDNNNETYRKPANRGSSSGDYRGSERRTRREPNSDRGSVQRRGSSGSGGNVSKPSNSGSSGRSSPPPSSKGSSNDGSSSNRRTRK